MMPMTRHSWCGGALLGANVFWVAVALSILSIPGGVIAQEGDRGSGRGPGQELIYVATPTVAPIRIQLPDGYDADQAYPLVVGLHGHGGRGDEFFTPAPSFAREGVVYAVLQAPYALAMAGRIGYSWNLRGVDNEAGDQGENELSIDYILKAVDLLVEKFDPEAVYLMGFSQGGTMTYQTAIAHHDRFTGFMVFGSWYRPEWFDEGEVAAANHLRVFVGHGRQDGVVERSTASRDILDSAGYDVVLYDYDGGHMIAQSALDEMFVWLRANER
jgi:phospholipase/carboxylesterase